MINTSQKKFPVWVHIAAAAWMLLWIPAYWKTWGPANFLHFCDMAVILSCLGIWTNSSLLLSSQAVCCIIGDSLWALDALWRVLAGHHLFGGTEYLFDARYPLDVRLLSLFHIALPIALLWTLLMTGYDRRGLPLQIVIAAILLVCGRFLPAAQNMNFAWRDPLFHRSWGPAPVHIVLMLAGVTIVTYLPAHWLLLRLFSRASQQK